jgi:hypothetical protein
MVLKKGKDKKGMIRIEISEEEILKRITQIESLDIADPELREFLVTALEALVRLDQIIGMKETTIAKLRKIFDKKIERHEPVKSSDGDNDKGDKPHPRGNNKGRNGKDKYANANKVKHDHETLKKGDQCPLCLKGILADYVSGIYIRITGSAPLAATIHETQKLRCNLCLEIFEAIFEGKDAPKYDEKAIALIALLKYAASIPFYRLGKIQDQLLTPLPASTQWDLVEGLGNDLFPLWKHWLVIASSGTLFYQDDTKGKVQTLIRENKIGDPKRKGIYTSSIIAELPSAERLVLYFTGRKYSGENLSDILKNYTGEGLAPIVMSDALASNKIKEEICKIIQALCLAHGRRKFFDLGDKFKVESDYVINLLKTVYATDEEAKMENLSAEARLELHKKKSGPAMEELKKWLDSSFPDRRIEPNSSLGHAVKYMIKNWTGLSEFLRTPGVPLDNNILEREFRTAVLNRKNWYFYRTEVGALIGDIILSAIKTCSMAKINVLDYFVWIQKNREDIKKNPQNYLPWNCNQETSGK